MRNKLRSLSLLATVLSASACFMACSPSSGGAATTDAGPEAGPVEGAAPAGFPFKPSNISLAGIDTSAVGDQDITSNCVITTGTAGTNGSAGGDCFDNSAVIVDQMQSDGTEVTVMIVNSIRIESTAQVTVSGGLPLVLVTLGDMTILGTFSANAQGDAAVGGGYSQDNGNTMGTGPGGGPAATGVAEAMPGFGGGGASYCGLGGRGAGEMGAVGSAASPTAAYGNATITPLVGGSAGGAGAVGAGAGGGAVQLVAGGAFAMNTGSFINVGGGGGEFGGTGGQNAGGGGSGGSILIEATTASIAGVLAANGAGGGGGGPGSASGTDGQTSSAPSAGGAGGSLGGAGSGGTTLNGSVGLDTAGDSAGGGGGGAGRIRINTSSGSAMMSGTLSPATSTPCATQGTVNH
jgi:hypothetical protein